MRRFTRLLLLTGTVSCAALLAAMLAGCPVQVPGYGMLTGIDPELVGTWKGSGQNLVGSGAATLVFRADGRFTQTHSDVVLIGGNYGVDTTPSPNHIDLVETESNIPTFRPTGILNPGIYEIDGDSLQLGYNAPSAGRPQSIETADAHYQLTRQPDKALDPADADDVAGDADAALAGAESLIGLGD